MRAAAGGFVWRDIGPRWETSQGGSRGVLGGVYGERALRLVVGVGLGLEPCPLFASARAVTGPDDRETGAVGVDFVGSVRRGGRAEHAGSAGPALAWAGMTMVWGMGA
jgi:hypothetical protein